VVTKEPLNWYDDFVFFAMAFFLQNRKVCFFKTNRRESQ